MESIGGLYIFSVLIIYEKLKKVNCTGVTVVRQTILKRGQCVTHSVEMMAFQQAADKTH